MKPDEAATLAGFLKGAFPSMTPEQVEVYESSLLYEDAALASKAILHGIREWKHPPRYAEIVETIRMFRRANEADSPREDQGWRSYRPSEPLPLWVKRWVYARYVCDPPDLRPLKEQHGFAQDVIPREGWMPDDAYVEEAKQITDLQVRRAVTASLGARLP